MNSPPSSSLLDLPTELLVEIFWQSDNPQLPIVCRDFCDIIHTTRQFWSFIHIGQKQYTPEATSFLSKRFERSVTWPLDVVIQATGAPTSLAIEIWLSLSTQRERIRTLDIATDTVKRSGTILYTVLLNPPELSTPSSLQKLDIRHDEDLDVPFHYDPMFPQILLHPIPSLFPALTTLILPLLGPCIPYPNSPITYLRTLVLDGSMSWSCDYPHPYQITQLLAQTPLLETFWCKEHRTYTYINSSSNSSTLQIDRFGTLPVNLPIHLPKLTKMAVVVPGLGANLLHSIEAPGLRDLHLDGTRDDEEFEDEVRWLNQYQPPLHAALQVTSSRSPALRRLSLVGAYLARDTWKWLLGCEEVHGVPFPLLEDITLREMRAVKGEVTNAVDDALMESFAKQGRLVLRRFAYLASEPPLGELQ
ncbi:hypothetical protein BJ912DRAFT_921910 [Pholiota molesta]|nr:hypothetical protein BJ912DRAFT_921910 [Pholiota molesta]